MPDTDLPDQDQPPEPEQPSGDDNDEDSEIVVPPISGANVRMPTSTYA